MKKISLILLFITIFIIAPVCIAEQTKVLQVGVSVSSVPKGFFGNWRVKATLISANCEGRFKKENVDIWNLSRSGDVLKLENPFSGVQATITLQELRGNFIKFKKVSNYDGQKLTDVVELKLDKETFVGFNYLKLDTISDIDGHVVKSETASYKIQGEKLSGTSIRN